MAIAIGKQSAVVAISDAATNTTCTWSGGGSSAPGSTIVLATVGWHASGYDGACNDSIDGTAYTKRTTGTTDNMRVMLQFLPNRGAVSSITQYHDQGTGCLGYCQAIEITEAAVASEDAAAQDIGDASATDGSVSLTTIDATTLVLSLLGIKNIDTALNITSPASYTNLGVQQDGTITGYSLDYRVLSSAGGQTISYAHDNATGSWGVSAISFEAISAAGNVNLLSGKFGGLFAGKL